MINNVEKIVTEFESSLLGLLLTKIKTYTNKEFIIADVFGKEWDRIPVSTRKNIGKKFAILVTNKKIKNIEFSIKDSSNKQWYKNKNF